MTWNVFLPREPWNNAIDDIFWEIVLLYEFLIYFALLAGSYSSMYSSSSFFIRRPFLPISRLLFVLEKGFLPHVFAKTFLWKKLSSGSLLLVEFHDSKAFSAAVVMVSSNSNGIHNGSTRSAYSCLSPLVLLLVASSLVDFEIGIIVTIFDRFIMTVLSFKSFFKPAINSDFAPGIGIPLAPRCYLKWFACDFCMPSIVIISKGDNVFD